DGVMTILALAKEKKEIATNEFDAALYSSPVFANGVLYIATTATLYAIQERSTNGAVLRQISELSPKESQLPDSAPRPLRIGRDRAPDAPFVPTPHDVVARMLELAGVQRDSLLIDLGSGRWADTNCRRAKVWLQSHRLRN